VNVGSFSGDLGQCEVLCDAPNDCSSLNVPDVTCVMSNQAELDLYHHGLCDVDLSSPDGGASPDGAAE
jgi:hypothetical protein